MLVWISSSTRHRRLLSYPLAHITVSGWQLFRAFRGYEHVAPGVLQVGVVSLLQDHYHVPHVAVHEVDPEGGPTRGPAHAVLHGGKKFSHHPRNDIYYVRGSDRGVSLPVPPFPLCVGPGNGSPYIFICDYPSLYASCSYL